MFSGRLAQVRLARAAPRRRRRTTARSRSTTRSPGGRGHTPPTASTTPAPSCPSTIGWRVEPRCPSARCTSEWHTPAAATRTSTSSSRGGASSARSTLIGEPAPAERLPPRIPSSRDPPLLQAHQDPARLRGRGRRAVRLVPSSAISSTNGSNQSRRRASTMPADRTAPPRRGGSRSHRRRAGWRSGRSRSTRCAATRRRPPARQGRRSGDSRRCRRQNSTSHWITSTLPRTIRSRASCSWRTISPAAMRHVAGVREGRVAVHVSRCSAAPPASAHAVAPAPPRRLARCPAPTWARCHRASASPGWRRP